MTMWRRRMAHHAAHGAACVHLFVNDGRAAGASQPHTHAQLVALDFVPVLVARERERFGAYATSDDGRQPARRPRPGGGPPRRAHRRDRRRGGRPSRPYASAAPYQLLIAPRRPVMRFEDEGPLGAGALHDALARLARRFGRPPALNLWVRTAPRGAEHYCWRIDIRPRLAAAGRARARHRPGPEPRRARARGARAARRVIAVALVILASVGIGAGAERRWGEPALRAGPPRAGHPHLRR